MNSLQKLTMLAILFIGSAMVAQENNVFMDRDFWKGNPDLETVKQKIADGNDAQALNSNAFDATIYAILANTNNDVVKYLLSLEGNPVDKKTHDSRIYLHWAAYAGTVDIVNHLLDLGASVTAQDSHGYTPLEFAVNAGQDDEALFNAFENNGVNLTEQKTEYGANLLLLAAPNLKSEKELDFFLNKGFELGSKDNVGNGIFAYASKKGSIEFLNVLVERGADYKSLNDQSGNAFLYAAQGARGYSNPLEVYEFLQGLGLEPNIVTTDGYTPLHSLAYNTTDSAIFKLFLDAGANVNQKDRDGNTPFLNAASRNELEIVQLLSKDVIDFNAKNKSGQTALMLATQRNNSQVVEFLLINDSDAFAKDDKGNTIAHYLIASYNNRNAEAFESKLQLLQDKGVKMNLTQAEGNTLLHLAAQENNLDLLKRVSAFEIDINQKNDEGLTALHIAAMKAQDDQMMKYLIAQGASTKIKTDFDETVQDLAKENELLQQQNTTLNFLN
ncbi:Ankyrin repeat [Nonlabens sp. Hel1_33_55]|uniref:ankyrin repeat domain-containing protein n=1 Tax=Nonlabens sp. Hel1_33_55 TaxID=1336802 RepID=UPI000875AA92|nr:ankyrin repeat domain-containing protein [Nonlabens sp. Hel1_33_55]SCX99044.1 Ankyrin repeat [Nonlabens sp. Hel1_33_55]